MCMILNTVICNKHKYALILYHILDFQLQNEEKNKTEEYSYSGVRHNQN